MNNSNRANKLNGKILAISTLQAHSNVEYRHTGGKLYIPKNICSLLKSSGVLAFDIEVETIYGNVGTITLHPVRKLSKGVVP